ncbi:MAG: hypothetical protein B7Y26_01010 [Hydrogenophilales bacterium 16-64-46]|nr:MAG: hypothetical protein B7Z32_09105 [Hydrogenophilales bacterium 12-64-13]OYZ07201.1 MAG: hypothetical protein B7Y26_01010 [Hydrogenophilales bacterium 16-64-46]OZA37331.1 MAG: hypothetical protein B7X87_11475 [Hydrogenophilales bacterium 17-64-34]
MNHSLPVLQQSMCQPDRSQWIQILAIKRDDQTTARRSSMVHDVSGTLQKSAHTDDVHPEYFRQVSAWAESKEFFGSRNLQVRAE